MQSAISNVFQYVSRSKVINIIVINCSLKPRGVLRGRRKAVGRNNENTGVIDSDKSKRLRETLFLVFGR